MPSEYGNNTATLMTLSPQPMNIMESESVNKCLTFWYHLFGRDPANFSLLANSEASPFTGKPQLLWIKRQPQSNNWDYYLMFRAQLMSSSRDVIGLDDITFTNTACPSTSICDFEVGFKLNLNFNCSNIPFKITRLTFVTGRAILILLL